MATTAADQVFIDTNVLVYASRPSAPEHAAARVALAEIETTGARVWISQQVLRDYLAVVTRPQATHRRCRWRPPWTMPDVSARRSR
jgi:predicted nucleic acid-binding protein